MIAILMFVAAASAQSCSCSVGGGASALPSGPGPRPGGVAIATEFGISATGTDGWAGFAAIDRDGNSMPGMRMPGHLAESARLGATVGLPSDFAVSVSVPYVHSHPLGPSDMVGDVDRSFIGDVGTTFRWGITRSDLFVGASLGATLPTGPVVNVVDGGGVRGGRGAVAGTTGVQAVWQVAPRVALGTAIGGAADLYTPKDGYVVGPTLDTALGARWWLREQGRVRFGTFALLQHQQHDVRGALVLDQTGITALSASISADWRPWSHKNRSVSLSVRVDAPLWQIDGDTWLARNGAIVFGFVAVPH